ncbi:MAG: hypothetical protein WCR02_03585 [Sphaerochaetaceae bacterium]
MRSNAQLCDYSWVLSLKEQCIEKKVPFHFKQTGTRFLKEGKKYHIRREIQTSHAQKAGIEVKNQA